MRLIRSNYDFAQAAIAIQGAPMQKAISHIQISLNYLIINLIALNALIYDAQKTHSFCTKWKAWKIYDAVINFHCMCAKTLCFWASSIESIQSGEVQ